MAILHYLGSDNKYHALPVGETITATEPESYSTEEQVIGQWIDGKPLYRKVYQLSNDFVLTGNSWQDTKISISNIKQIVRGLVVRINNATNQTDSLNDIMVNINNNVIKLYRHTTIVIEEGYIILEYTKTTDNPKSFSIDMLTTMDLDAKATAAEVAFCV